jgi:hypothetical protein
MTDYEKTRTWVTAGAEEQQQVNYMLNRLHDDDGDLPRRG